MTGFETSGTFYARAFESLYYAERHQTENTILRCFLSFVIFNLVHSRGVIFMLVKLQSY